MKKKVSEVSHEPLPHVSTLGESIVVLDIETLATSHNAVVLEIGAVYLGGVSKLHEDRRHNMMQAVLPVLDQVFMGREISESTVAFHRRIGTSAVKYREAPDISKTLDRLVKFFQQARFDSKEIDPDGTFRVWTRGFFDTPILESLFAQHNVEVPWRHYEVCNARTYEEAMLSVLKMNGVPVPDVVNIKNTTHEALEDAIWQLSRLRAIDSAVNSAVSG